MKKFALVTLALVTFVAGGARAADPTGLRPVVVVSFGGYDSLKSDVGFLGELGGKPETAQMMEGMLAIFTQGQGLAGLDKTRPWGAVISTDGTNTPIVGIVPVTDLGKLLNLLAPFKIDAEKGDDGVWEVNAQAAPPIFVKERDKWAYISDKPENLALPLGNPGTMLADLAKQYDFGVRIDVQNVPQDWRDMAMTQMRAGMESGFESAEGEDEEVLAQRKKMAEGQIAQIEKAMKEIDQFVMGFKIDEIEKNAVLGGTITFVPGTDSAKQIAGANLMKSVLTGFRRDDAVMSGHSSSSIPPDQFEQIRQNLDQSFATIEAQIEKEKNAARKQIASDFIAAVKKTVEATLKKGHLNFGATVTGEGPFTMVAGAVIAEGKSLEAAAKKALTELRKESNKEDEVEIEFDAEQYKGVNFHTLSFDLPDGDGKDDVVGRAIFGESGEITIGFSEDRAFFAIGEDGLDEIKKVIDDSAAPAKSLPLADGYLSILPILQFVYDNAEDFEVDDAEVLKGIIDGLEENGKDKVRMEASLIPNGEKFSIVFEEGLLKAFGEGAKMAAAQAAPAGAF